MQNAPIPLPAGTTRVRFELGWSAAFTDVDASCIGLDASGACQLVLAPFAAFASCKGLTVGKHGGDRWTGIGKGEKIIVTLMFIPPAITALYFVASVASQSKTLATVADGLHATMLNVTDGPFFNTPIVTKARIDVPPPTQEVPSVNGIILFALYRDLSGAADGLSGEWSLECPMAPTSGRKATPKGGEFLSLAAHLNSEQQFLVQAVPNNYAEVLARREAAHDAAVKDFGCGCVAM